ncbi:hypothetical protein GCM10011591_10400 [Nocardia camponoti]|uniref:Uncharacterized protein n=1 Tax=Nocardia camponoti TaxID=1616106 RepID=A0A917V5S6_9NOCA|nr:hypothetical protein GCM10011591_10400 [Nocardia camponoti]
MSPADRPGAADAERVVRMLQADPWMRFTEIGRRVLRMLGGLPQDPGSWVCMVDALPSHCAPAIVELARRHSQNWAAFAQAVSQREELRRSHEPRVV